MALGYLLGKASSKFLKVNFNIPAVLVLSILPDIDILFPFIQHRGPAHSIIVALIVFIPFFAVYHQRVLPYFFALISHSLGDFFIGGQIQLFWPVTRQVYGFDISMQSLTNIALEWILFLTSILIMFKSKDLFVLFRAKTSNLLLAIPTFTVLLPTFLNFPLKVPALLVLPHLVYLVMFSVSILIAIPKFFRLFTR
jgi:membrane-bound metal-dependent hydrolase YbcI (DUF457 family)